MKDKIENKNRKLEKNCHYHENYPANFICDSCGRSICYYCQRNNAPPYQCPECMPEYWAKKMKKERTICLTPIIITITLIALIVIWGVLNPYEYEGYTYLEIENEDIIPTLDLGSFNKTGNNEIDLSLKVYVTNDGAKDSGDVFIELYILSSGITRVTAASETSSIKADKTEIFTIDTTIIIGEYDLQLMIWEDGKVVQRGVKGINVSGTDIKELSAYDVIYDTGDVDEEGKGSAEFDTFASPGLFLPVLIVVMVVLIIGWLFYRGRSKPPIRPMQPPPANYYNSIQHRQSKSP